MRNKGNHRFKYICFANRTLGKFDKSQLIKWVPWFQFMKLGDSVICDHHMSLSLLIIWMWWLHNYYNMFSMDVSFCIGFVMYDHHLLKFYNPRDHYIFLCMISRWLGFFYLFFYEWYLDDCFGYILWNYWKDYYICCMIMHLY